MQNAIFMNTDHEEAITATHTPLCSTT